jgi:RimJ/RimL family protein N-acetyltransferase
MIEDFIYVPASIKTERTIIRRYKEGDGKEVFELLSANKERFMDSFPRSVAAVTDEHKGEFFVRNKIVEWYTQKNFFFAIEEKNSGKYIGQASIKSIEWEIPKAEMAYYLDKNQEGKGLASEVVKRLITLAFEQLNIKKLFLRIHKNNLKSCRLAENCGFIHEGVHRKEFLTHDKKLVDVIFYGLTDEDYNKVKSDVGVIL